MKNRLGTICLAIIFFSVSFVVGMNAQAGELDFSVRAILPESQRSKDISYFDLRVKLGAIEKLSVELTNDTDKDVTVITSANSAITNDNGITDYSHKETKKDSSAAVTFSEISEMSEEITIPANSKKMIECVVTMPKESFDGYILGGLYFEQKDDGSEDAKKGDSVAVGNRFSYVVGVLLSETDKEVKPELALNNVEATQINGNNAVIMNIQNKQAAMIKKLKVDGELYYENEKKPRYENHQVDLTMAPNTNFNYRIDLKEQAFIPGNYTVKLKANDGYKDWTWEEKFTIKEKEAKEYNSSAVNLPPEKNSFPWVTVAVIVVVLLVVIIGIIYYFQKKMKKEHAAQQAKYDKLKQRIKKSDR
ncbi:DUF916 and DUF3324 domain-containing protein [Enterococcus sp. 5H]|uniref:DUF916 and DUF3324 domain-containing protein n=1 Tax=Enterococcus sp. 5H TaxID=1229490 RepID=UPI0023044BCF|nr:DUF916 and DUF3324 domain-containing protein [Enterococcus sp. 5H]MDA9472394.1 cell surface protein precursor [Enterococcus sp. 5H]